MSGSETTVPPGGSVLELYVNLTEKRLSETVFSNDLFGQSLREVAMGFLAEAKTHVASGENDPQCGRPLTMIRCFEALAVIRDFSFTPTEDKELLARVDQLPVAIVAYGEAAKALRAKAQKVAAPVDAQLLALAECLERKAASDI
jgi:hypothetical protein